MARTNTSPSAGSTILDKLKPYEGGTGQTAAIAALAAMDAIPLTAVGKPNGIAGLGADKKLPVSSLPVDSMSIISVSGPSLIVKSSNQTYQITNFDAFTTYDIVAISGAVGVNGDTITYSAPNIAGAGGFTINGRSFPVTISDIKPAAPTLSAVDIYGTATTANLSCTGSTFAMLFGTNTHLNSDWQIASDSAFTTIVSQSAADAVNKTTWTGTGLALNTTYYARLRYRDSGNGVSDWSNTVTFTTKSTYVIGTEEAKLRPGANGTILGNSYAVAINSDGSRVAIGIQQDTSGPTPGSVYIYTRSGLTWNLEQRLNAPSGDGSTAFGSYCVEFSDASDRIAIGAHTASKGATNAAGAVYVFSRSGTTWTQEAKLQANTASANAAFGRDLSSTSDMSRLVIGSKGYSSQTGEVYVFSRSGTTWTQEQRIAAVGGVASGSFGTSVAISGDGLRLAIGSPVYNDTGKVFIYLRTSTTWNLEGSVVGSDAGISEFFGIGQIDFTSDGSRLVCNNCSSLIGNNTGAVYIFSRSGTTWTQEAKLAPAISKNQAYFGQSSSITPDGTKLAVGAPGDDSVAGSGVAGSGAVYVYTRSGTTWSLHSKVTPSDRATSTIYSFGSDVALSGDGTRLIVGEPNNADASTEGTYIYR